MRFVLVHGGLHGAWCWKYLIAELEAMGHDAIAIDLPGHGQRVAEESTLSGYRSAVMDVLEPDDVLVGHSMGGPVITMAADSFPRVGHLVYLAAGFPAEGGVIVHDLRGSEVETNSGNPIMPGAENPLDKFVEPTEDGLSVRMSSVEGAREYFYHDCSSEMVKWAFNQLTPQRMSVLVDEKIHVPNFWVSNIPRSYIMTTDDHAASQPYMRIQADRLGVEPLRINASHSPFMSRPAELAKTIMSATNTKPVRPPRPTL
jgi:pimeloyl-ACP methyl ester carboxylesterase